VAISEKERAFVSEQFAKAQKEKRLIEVEVLDPEPLYAVGDDEAIVVVRLQTRQTPPRYDLWAIDRTATPIVGVMVGIQDEYGRNDWRQLGNSPVEGE
jgi:hypothetical protein